MKTWHPLSVLWLFSFENFVCDSVDLPLWIHCDFHNVPLWFIVRIIIHSIYKLIFDWYNSKQDPKILSKPSTVLEELIKRQIYYFHQKNFDILGFWYFLTGNSNLSLVFSLDWHSSSFPLYLKDEHATFVPFGLIRNASKEWNHW